MARQEGIILNSRETIIPPPGVFEMADRLAGEYFHTQARYGTLPINKVLGMIYLMGFMHAFEAMDEVEKRNDSKVGVPHD